MLYLFPSHHLLPAIPRKFFSKLPFSLPSLVLLQNQSYNGVTWCNVFGLFWAILQKIVYADFNALLTKAVMITYED